MLQKMLPCEGPDEPQSKEGLHRIFGSIPNPVQECHNQHYRMFTSVAFGQATSSGFLGSDDSSGGQYPCSPFFAPRQQNIRTLIKNTFYLTRGTPTILSSFITRSTNIRQLLCPLDTSFVLLLAIKPPAFNTLTLNRATRKVTSMIFQFLFYLVNFNAIGTLRAWGRMILFASVAPKCIFVLT